MKKLRSYAAKISAFLLILGAIGCRSDYGAGSPYHPGPTAGKAIGTGAGVVVGNAAGFGVGVVEGAASGVAAPFDPSYHMVRYWKTETTADGRTVQVPYDVLVDQYGRPANMPAPTGRPAPPPAAPDTNAPVK